MVNGQVKLGDKMYLTGDSMVVATKKYAETIDLSKDDYWSSISYGCNIVLKQYIETLR